NRRLSETELSEWKADYPARRRFARQEARTGWISDPPIGAAFDVSDDTRQREYERRWRQGGANFLYAFSDLGVDERANATAAEFVRSKIHEIVTDPSVAETLTPRDY